MLDVLRTPERWKTQFSPSGNSQRFWEWTKCARGHGRYRRRYSKISTYRVDTKGPEHFENVQGKGGDWKVAREDAARCLLSWCSHLPWAWVPALAHADAYPVQRN